ncbi:hypothetical protein N7537_006435 [Penicillium hordei]|uniref:Uncharacterized protein n=1 Tax=Penicillium hordei TaxID=40994 RepID=A0AAD6E7L7_9EURO|nr:uncharacterized protein N7537_006435 [Penicillium hordei]KAJ5603479.1 hypothetical protein N7537_006435 [Penicillium hordei]
MACYECGLSEISSYSGRLCGDEHMETWIIALLQHATTADLQGSQGGSHVIVPEPQRTANAATLRRRGAYKKNL